jgi:hypothetical protein
MSATQYEDLPDLICNLLQADSWFATSGIGVFLDAAHFFPDETSSNTVSDNAKAAYDSLLTNGLIISVESWAAGQLAQAGTSGFLVCIPRVFVIEIPNVNRGSTGLNLRPAVVCRKILAALLGQPKTSPSQQKFALPAAGSVFEPYSKVGSRYEYPVRLQINTSIN